MSSSSSEVETGVGLLLAESFQVLAREQPVAYARMCARLAGLSVALAVDGEHFAATFAPRAAWVGAATGTECAWVATRRSTVLDVLSDRRSLTEAVLANAVEVVGPLDTLLRLHEGLVVYVQGAVRCPGFAPLLRRLHMTGSSGA